jgi:hypothetical protein
MLGIEPTLREVSLNGFSSPTSKYGWYKSATKLINHGMYIILSNFYHLSKLNNLVKKLFSDQSKVFYGENYTDDSDNY